MTDRMHRLGGRSSWDPAAMHAAQQAQEPEPFVWSESLL